MDMVTLWRPPWLVCIEQGEGRRGVCLETARLTSWLGLSSWCDCSHLEPLLCGRAFGWCLSWGRDVHILQGDRNPNNRQNSQWGRQHHLATVNMGTSHAPGKAASHFDFRVRFIRESHAKESFACSRSLLRLGSPPWDFGLLSPLEDHHTHLLWLSHFVTLQEVSAF